MNLDQLHQKKQHKTDGRYHMSITNNPSHLDGLEELLDSTRYLEYLQAVSYFHNYSCRNILLILQQIPQATKVANFETWKIQYKRPVVRGAKGAKILTPVPEKPKTKLVEKIDPDTGNPILDTNGKKILEEVTILSPPKFKETSVFDITQTKGETIQKLSNNILNDNALYGAFFDSVQSFLTVPTGLDSAGVSGKSQVIKGFISEIVTEKSLTVPQVGEKLAHDSIVFIICKHFCIDTAGLSFEYFSSLTVDIVPFFIEILEVIKTKSSELITTLENIFKQTCEQRNINPMMDYEDETTKPKPHQPSPISIKEQPQEPTHTIFARTEKTAIGVDFMHYDVIPVKPVFDVVAEMLPAQAPQAPKTTEQSSKPVEELQTQDTKPDVPSTQQESTPKTTQPDTTQTNGDIVLGKIMSEAKDFSDVDVYSHSLEQAQEHGYTEVYKFNQLINMQCTADIDIAIKSSKVADKPSEYRIAEAVNRVVTKFGRNRTAWVLAMTVKNSPNDTFNKENKKWANEILDTFGYPNEPASFFITTIPVLLNTFIMRFRELQKQKLGYSERIQKAQKRVQAQT